MNKKRCNICEVEITKSNFATHKNSIKHKQNCNYQIKINPLEITHETVNLNNIKNELNELKLLLNNIIENIEKL